MGISRRTFLGAAGIGGAVAMLPKGARGQARRPKVDDSLPAGVPKLPFELGVASYTFREFPLERAIEMSAAAHLRRIAFKSVHIPLEAPDAEVRAAADKARAAGLDPYGCGVVYMTSEAEVRNAFRYARAGGMSMIIGVPNHELLPLADALARETGIKLAIHNHGPGDKLYPTPASVVERIERLGPNVGLCLDVGHAERVGVNPAAAVERFAGRLLDVHIKDETASTPAGEPVEVGKGVVDIGRLLAALLKVRFSGTVAFEYEKDGADPMPGLLYSLGYVHGRLAGLTGAATLS